MLNLTFGEQVKIILSRRGMTIKELAEQIEKYTGKKMSRQNLTQRLGRDNFQEQDMRMIAEILECPFQLNILGDNAEEAAAYAQEYRAHSKKQKAEENKDSNTAQTEHHTSREMTIGELVDMMEASPDIPEGNYFQETLDFSDVSYALEPAEEETPADAQEAFRSEESEANTEEVVGEDTEETVEEAVEEVSVEETVSEEVSIEEVVSEEIAETIISEEEAVPEESAEEEAVQEEIQEASIASDEDDRQPFEEADSEGIYSEEVYSEPYEPEEYDEETEPVQEEIGFIDEESDEMEHAAEEIVQELETEESQEQAFDEIEEEIDEKADEAFEEVVKETPKRKSFAAFFRNIRKGNKNKQQPPVETPLSGNDIEIIHISDEVEDPLASAAREENGTAQTESGRFVKRSAGYQFAKRPSEALEQEEANTEEEVQEEAVQEAEVTEPVQVTGQAAAEERTASEKAEQPIVKEDVEDLERGDINPYTGHEYETNSVRMHPSRIGYVQVYDRSDHAWTDMTEWAFLGYQERKKALLGDEYESPIYLD